MTAAITSWQRLYWKCVPGSKSSGSAASASAICRVVTWGAYFSRTARTDGASRS